MKRFGVRVYKEYFNFAASHFLVFPDGGREELHGHNYQVRVRVRGAMGPGEMVVDFCRLKPIVRRHCDALDHKMLLPGTCSKLELRDDGDHLEVRFQRNDGGVDRFLFPRKDVVVLPLANTSTERLAELIGEQVAASLRTEVPEAHLTGLEVEVEEASGQCGVFALDLGADDPAERAE